MSQLFWLEKLSCLPHVAVVWCKKSLMVSYSPYLPSYYLSTKKSVSSNASLVLWKQTCMNNTSSSGFWQPFCWQARQILANTEDIRAGPLPHTHLVNWEPEVQGSITDKKSRTWVIALVFRGDMTPITSRMVSNSEPSKPRSWDPLLWQEAFWWIRIGLWPFL